MLSIIPRPATIVGLDGSLPLDTLTGVSANTDEALQIARQFVADLRRWTGRDLGAPTVGTDAASGEVRFELAVSPEVRATPLSPESTTAVGAHSVRVDSDGIRIVSDSAEGLYRGASSAVQLIGTAEGSLAHVEIADAARYGWRGLSLDSARHFIPMDEVKGIIDVLALYKLDVLHLHLSDNEGWRLEIAGRPELTPTATDGTRAFYSVHELAEITAYAAARFITVIPELDLPGHVGAAIRAYPALNPAALAGLGSPFPMANLDPDSEDAWRFVDDVLTALCAATSGPFIHIGGDEAFGMDDEAHERFVDHILVKAQELGKRVVGWQEISRASAGPDHIVQHWIDFAGAVESGDGGDDEQGAAAGLIPAEILAMLKDNFIKAARDVARIAAKGPRVIMSPTGNAYLDRPHAGGSHDADQHARRTEFGLAYYPPTPLASYLEWNPEAVSPAIPADRIVGVEAALWTENASTAEHRGVLLLPRLPAIAEVAWGAEQAGWDEFRDRLALHSQMWEHHGLDWYQSDAVAWKSSPALLETDA